MSKAAIVVLALSVVGSLAAHIRPPLAARQDTPTACEGDRLPCGPVCMDPSWTCCPDSQLSCPPNSFCHPGVGGIYACCPEGSECEGVGDPTDLPNLETMTTAAPSTALSEDIGSTTSVLDDDEPSDTTVTIITEDPTSRWEPSHILPPSPYPTSLISNETLISAPPQTSSPTAAPSSAPNSTATTAASTSSLSTTTAPDAGAINGYSTVNMLGGLVAGFLAFIL